MLTAIGATCKDISANLFEYLNAGTEDCQNGIDDDGDGLIDLFDTECQCSESSYQAHCPVVVFYSGFFPNIT